MDSDKIIELLHKWNDGEISLDKLKICLERYSVDTFDMANIEIIDEDEEAELISAINKGDENAKRTLLRSHIALVTSIAEDFYDGPLSYKEIILAGVDGLKEAVERYDVRVGYKFSVHAIWWIRQTITRRQNVAQK